MGPTGRPAPHVAVRPSGRPAVRPDALPGPGRIPRLTGARTTGGGIQSVMRRLVLLVAAVLALAACSSAGFDGRQAGSDGELACTLVRRLPERMPDQPADGSSDRSWDVAVGRLNTAAELARVAALEEEKYQPLADALATARQTFSTTFDLHGAEPGIKQARTHC